MTPKCHAMLGDAQLLAASISRADELIMSALSQNTAAEKVVTDKKLKRPQAVYKRMSASFDSVVDALLIAYDVATGLRTMADGAIIIPRGEPTDDQLLSEEGAEMVRNTIVRFLSQSIVPHYRLVVITRAIGEVAGQIAADQDPKTYPNSYYLNVVARVQERVGAVVDDDRRKMAVEGLISFANTVISLANANVFSARLVSNMFDFISQKEGGEQ